MEWNKMKILIVVSELGYRGTPRVVASYAKILSEVHQVLVWGWKEGGDTVSTLRRDGIRVIVGAECADEAMTFSPDVLNIHHSGFVNDEVCEIVGKFKKIGTRCIETNIFGYLDPRLVKMLDVSIQISLWDLWQWQKWKGASLPDIGVYCPNPVDTESFRPATDAEISEIRSKWGIPESGFVFGRAGKTDWDSVAPYLLAALAEFDNLFFVSVADYNGGIPDVLLKHSRVKLIDRMSSEKALSLFYSACDVMLSASGIGESFGLVNAEAMACGTPVVAVAKPLLGNAQAEVVCNREGGIVIADTKYLETAIKILMEDHELLRFVSSNARRLIENRYSYGVVKDMLLAVFENRLNDNILVRTCDDKYIKELVENVEGENSKWLPVAMKLRFNRVFRIVTNKVKEFL
jgi:glycosyltransferase involved in cell wall biosynthesis